ncbi:MAG: hypothetical protein AB7D34_04830 [Sulfurimonas sp.]
MEEIFILMDKVTQEALKPLKFKNLLDGIGAKIGMIIRFYFPHLKDDYNQFLKVYQDTVQKTMSFDDTITLTKEEIMIYYKAYRTFINKVVRESEKYI